MFLLRNKKKYFKEEHVVTHHKNRLDETVLMMVTQHDFMEKYG